MQTIIFLIVLFCGIQIYRKKGTERLNWFVGSMLLLGYASFIERPFLPANRLFLLVFLLSLWKNHELQGIKFPLKIPFIIYLIGLFVISFNAAHLTLFYKIYKPVMLLLETYGIIILGYVSAKSAQCISKPIISILFIVLLYGVFTFVTHSDPYRFIISPQDADFMVNRYLFGHRTRIASTWSHPISYGFVCCVFFFVCLTARRLIGEKYKILLFLIVCSIFICGSRTVLLCFLLMVLCYVMTMFNIGRQIKYISIITALGLFTMFLIPSVANKMENLIMTMQGVDDSSGSSIDMREMQMEASLAIASQFPITGGGLDYAREVMGFGTDEWNNEYREELQGMESIIYTIIIERGLVGIVIELFIIGSILWYAFRRKVLDRIDVGMVLALGIGFIVFAVLTSPLDSWRLTMFYIGYYIYRIHQAELNKKYEQLQNKDNETF